MANDLIENPGGGTLQPYSPGTLQPVESQWQVSQPDFLTEYANHSAGASTFFGQPFSPDKAPVLQQFTNDICHLFRNDLSKLGFAPTYISHAESWFKEVAFTGPTGPTHHSYSLRGFKAPPSDMAFVNSFCHRMAEIAAPQQFIEACLWLVAELNKRMGQGQTISRQPQQTSNYDQFTDAEWRIIEGRVPGDIAACETALKDHWGWAFQSNLDIVRRYIAGLPQLQRDYLQNTIIQGGQHCLNNPEIILKLYHEAIAGVGNRGQLPNSGAALQNEIREIEKMMRDNRTAYNKSPEIQARYRELVILRDGG